MATLLISQQDVPRLLPMRECIDVMGEALQALARGETQLPLRTVIPVPEGRGAFAAMPAVLNNPAAIGIKVITVYPGNHGTDFDSHQGAVLLFEPAHGSLAAIMDASSITAIRTAAVSAVATRALAREDARTLAIIGTGVQAVTHLEAMLAVRPITSVRVWSREAAHARHFIDRESGSYKVKMESPSSVEDAVNGADIVCTVTSAREPILEGRWIRAGAHVNAVGASTRATREIDSEMVRRSRFYADRRESTLNEGGDFLKAREEGLVTDAHILGEVGDVLVGKAPGRQTAEDGTLFKSLGLAIEDVAAAHFIYQKAQNDPGIQRIELGGRRG